MLDNKNANAQIIFVGVETVLPVRSFGLDILVYAPLSMITVLKNKLKL